jgi:signal transduction histidine kinase
MQGKISQDQAVLLYRQGAGGVAMSIIAACFLATLPDAPAEQRRSLIWLGGMLLILFARAADIVRHRRQRVKGINGRREIRRFAIGVILTAVMWGIFPVLFFQSMSELDRTYTATILSGMAGGSATVLAAVQYIVWLYCAAVLLPASIMFLLAGGQANISLGILGIVFFCVMALSSRLTHRATLDAFRLSRELDSVNRSLRNEIEEHHTTEARLRQAQKLEAIGQLTAGIAHDFNNLLMSIGGNAEFLLRRLGPGKDPAKRLISILRATEKGGRLTHQMLAFARKQTLQPQHASLNDIILAMDNLITSSLADSIVLELDLATDLWQTFVDQGQMTQVILNLVINAKDAMPSGGKLTIHTENVARNAVDWPHGLPSDRYVLLAINDTGTGMSDEVLSQAFDPFFTTKPVGAGSGLGLSQVHGIVQQSGGITTIRSLVGRGTTVSIYLPKAGPAEVHEVQGDVIGHSAASAPTSETANL